MDTNQDPALLEDELVANHKENSMFVSKEAEDTVDRFIDAVTHAFKLEKIAARAVASEGTPAIKDAFVGFVSALAEAMNASTKMQELAASELHDLRKQVSKC